MLTDLKPATELAKRHPHGVRIRYMGGCRCMLCRAANSRYETLRAARRRAGLSNGIVRATRVRNKLRRLSAAGIGRRSVSRAIGITSGILQGIATGRRRFCREETARRILSMRIPRALPGVLVDAGPTWQLIEEMLAAGGRKAWIARAIGGGPTLQLGRHRIMKRNADRVAELHRHVFARLRRASS